MVNSIMLAFALVAMVVGAFGMNYNTWMAADDIPTSKVRRAGKSHKGSLSLKPQLFFVCLASLLHPIMARGFPLPSTSAPFMSLMVIARLLDAEFLSVDIAAPLPIRLPGALRRRWSAIFGGHVVCAMETAAVDS